MEKNEIGTVAEQDPLVEHKTAAKELNEAGKDGTDAPRDLTPTKDQHRHSPHKRSHRHQKPNRGFSEIHVEDIEGENEERDGLSTGCCSSFGVRNYLHHFYGSNRSGDCKYTCSHRKAKNGRQENSISCFGINHHWGTSSFIFKLSLLIGGLILASGLIALLVAVCISKRPSLIGEVDGIAVIDRNAAAHNAEVDALILMSLIALILGAIVVICALLSRTFCRRISDYDDCQRNDFYLTDYDIEVKHSLLSAPSTSKKNSNASHTTILSE